MSVKKYKNNANATTVRKTTKAIGVPALIKKADLKNYSGQKKELSKDMFSKVSNMRGLERRDYLNSLIKSNNYSEDSIADLMAEYYQLQKINFAQFEIDPKVIPLLSKKICEKYVVMPIMEVENILIIAFADPGDLQAKDDISLLINKKIEIVVAASNEIKNMISLNYSDESADKVNRFFSVLNSVELEQQQLKLSQKTQSKNKKSSDPTIQTVDHIIEEGIRKKCSDIHIEIYEKICRVRYRVDGSLFEYIKPPMNMAANMVSRIKVMSQLDISEKRLPQDGRLKITVNGKVINFRVSTVPAVNGEKIVLRILDDSSLGADIDELGMNQRQLAIFKKYLGLSQGLILMTGPTGSGKTTTIYSGLQLLNKSDKNLSTAEDPVEYKLYGINQVQVNAKIGLTFGSVLRSFLRQDPDIILVGEIRDLETANIAYRAAATGHLVLSTLHTNDAASTVIRLVDMGLPAYSVAENTSVVVAQRLLRVLCNRCKKPTELELDFLENLGFSKEEAKEAKPLIMKPVGCVYCNHSGYKGRNAIFEVLEITSDVKSGILKGLPPMKLKKMAIEKNGLQTLRKSALEKLTHGVTSVEEVMYGTLEDDL